MTHYVIRHPGIDVPAIVPSSSLEIHLAKGFVRVSEAIDPADVDLADYADAPDLDAPPEPGDDTEPAAPAKKGKSTKESDA